MEHAYDFLYLRQVFFISDIQTVNVMMFLNAMSSYKLQPHISVGTSMIKLESDNKWQRMKRSGTTSDNKWQREIQRVTTSGAMSTTGQSIYKGSVIAWI